jgi:hypothetical protein
VHYGYELFDYGSMSFRRIFYFIELGTGTYDLFEPSGQHSRFLPDIYQKVSVLIKKLSKFTGKNRLSVTRILKSY